jgi:hypothetical protein
MSMKQPPIADQDIGGGRACRPFSHNDKQFEWGQKLTRDEVLAIPLDKRRAWVELGFLKIFKRPRQQRHADVSAAPVTEKPPPWNWKAPTDHENDGMRAWIKKTLTALLEHDATVRYEGSIRSLRPFASKPRDLHYVITRMMVAGAKREALYGNLEPLRKRLPGAEELVKNPPGKQGQPRPQRERDERNSRLLLALEYVDRIRSCFPSGNWPRALVVEIVAAHYGFGVEEVEKARHRGAKEVEKTLRHLTS